MNEEKKLQEKESNLDPVTEESTEEKLFSVLYDAYNQLKAAKPNDRSELDRCYAVTITEMEKLVAYFYTWCASGPVSE